MLLGKVFIVGGVFGTLVVVDCIRGTMRYKLNVVRKWHFAFDF